MSEYRPRHEGGSCPLSSVRLEGRTSRLLLLAAWPLSGIEGWVEGIEVAAVQMVLNITQGFPEPLEMDDLPLAQETDGITHIVVLDHAQDVVVGGAGLLLCRQVLEQIGNGVSFGLEFTGIKGNAARCLGPDSGGMVNIVRTEAGFLDLLRR